MAPFIFGEEEPHKPKLKSSEAFYNDCVTDFHAEAKKFGVLKKGLVFIPELIPLGQKTILEFLKDPYYQMQYGNNAQQYYYLILALSIDAGMCLATRWHENFQSLNQYVEEIIENGPADDANTLMNKYFPSDVMGNQGNDFFPIIFYRWLKMHEPYWNLADPREYTLKALLAAYQLGVSMILEKYGY